MEHHSTHHLGHAAHSGHHHHTSHDPEVPRHVETEPESELVTQKQEKDNLSIPIAIVIAGVMIAGAIIYTERPTGDAVGAAIPSRNEAGADTDDAAPTELLALKNDDHVLGNPNADVLVIEYSDTECPFCKRFHETMNQVMDQYGKSGSVAWVYRHFPLDQLHPKARKEAEALECAAELGGNEMFWKYTNRIFAITPANDGLDPAKLPEVAQELGLDVGRFSSCLSSGKYAARVQRDFENGVKIGVRGTPYSIVWNKKTGKQMTINGAYPFDNVKTIIGLVAGGGN